LGSKFFKKIERCYRTGEVIFEQGQPSDGIYSVKVGRVSVYKTQPGPSGPVDIELVRLGPGSMFGEMGMLDQTNREASVKALEYTECIVISRDMFETQMNHLPPWVVNIIKILIGRLRITNEKLMATMKVLEAHGLSAESDKDSASPDAAVLAETDPKPTAPPKA
jgi:CRP-like cAMP-binding protein